MNALAPAFEAQRAAFLESLRVRGQSPATLRSRGESLGAFFPWLGAAGISDVREVTRETIRSYQRALRTAELSTATIHARLIALRRFFEHLEAQDAILFNPCAGLVLPPLGDRLPRAVLTKAEARKILDAPDTQTKKGIRDRAILEAFYSTGLRGAEMAALTVHDVDTRAGFVRVRRGKGARERVVPLGEKAARCVAEYLAQVRRPWSEEKKDERALWLSAIRPHQPMSQAAIALMVSGYKRAAGIDQPGRTHLWRHTCATHLVAAGVSLAHVQRLLGHRSLRTTQIYTRVAPAEVQATHRRAHPRAKVRAVS